MPAFHDLALALAYGVKHPWTDCFKAVIRSAPVNWGFNDDPALRNAICFLIRLFEHPETSNKMHPSVILRVEEGVLIEKRFVDDEGGIHTIEIMCGNNNTVEQTVFLDGKVTDTKVTQMPEGCILIPDCVDILLEMRRCYELEDRRDNALQQGITGEDHEESDETGTPVVPGVSYIYCAEGEALAESQTPPPYPEM